MPKSVPLRAIVVTTCCRRSLRRPPSAACRPASPRLRKKWSLPPTNRTDLGDVGAARRCRPASGSSSRSSISVPARLRLWPSSPICTIWPMIALMSTGPCRAHAPRAAAGPSTALIQRSRSIDLGGVRAVAQHLAQALVEGAPGRAAVDLVPQLEHPHRRRDHAGHRPDRAAVVARLQLDPAGARAVASASSGRRREPLEEHRADQRTAQRPGRALPARSAARRAGTAGARGRGPREPGRTSTSVGGWRSIAVERRPLASARRGSAITRARASSVPGSGGRQSTA